MWSLGLLEHTYFTMTTKETPFVNGRIIRSRKKEA